MAISKVYFKCNDSWNKEIDGVVVGAFLVVFLKLLLLTRYNLCSKEIPARADTANEWQKHFVSMLHQKNHMDQRRLNAIVPETGFT